MKKKKVKQLQAGPEPITWGPKEKKAETKPAVQKDKKIGRARIPKIDIPGDVTPTTLSAEQSEEVAKTERAHGFFVAADKDGNVIWKLSGGGALLSDPVQSRKLAFALLHVSEIAHLTRGQMGSPKGYQKCEPLFHCNCFFSLTTDKHTPGKMRVCCFCDLKATEKDEDIQKLIGDGT